MHLTFKYYILLILFFATMLTSLWPKNTYILFLFSVTIWGVLPYNKWWDKISLSLLLFSVFYCIFGYLNDEFGSGFTFITTLIGPVAFYRFGRWLMTWLIDEQSRIKFFFWAFLCYLVPLFLLTMEDIALVGLVNDKRVMLSEIGKEDSTLSATLYGLMSSIGIGMLSAIFLRDTKLSYKLGLITISLLSLLVVIHLVNRTGLVLFAASIIFSFAYVTKLKFNKLIPAIIIIALVFIAIYLSGVISSEVIDAYAQRETSSTSNAAEIGGRSDMWVIAIDNLITHPTGWTRDSYSHNLWLDLAAIGGWVPFFSFLIATFSTFKNTFKVYLRKVSQFPLLLLTIIVSMTLNSMVEPVIEGSLLFFVIYMMMWGILYSVSKESKESNTLYENLK